MSSEQLRIDRRTVLGTICAGTLVALAGCLGDDDSESGDESDGTDDGDSQETDTGEMESLDQPVDVPEGESCAVCNMAPAEHPDWNAQLVHGNEDRTFFCSSGCLAAYTAKPQQFDGPDSPIENAWVTGYETGDLLSAADAHFVRVTDSGHVDDIMKMNPTPFATRDDAVAFVDAFDAYGEDDIIGFDTFDMDLAVLYRGQFFDEDSS